MRDRTFPGDVNIREILRNQHWIWAFAGALALWIVMGLVTIGVNVQSLFSNGSSAAFLIIAALGQMFVISTGRGAIDLSIPGVITLTAFVATGFINGHDIMLVPGIPLILLIGAAIGFVNSLVVLFLRIPPIIATLGTGYILTTAALLYNQGFSAFAISKILNAVSSGRVVGIPLIILFAILISILAALLLHRTTFGRSLIAVGQNIRAAELAGINVRIVQIIAYIISGICGATAGMLLSARVGGAFLGMGSSYLLETVGSVVIGGTLIFGGRSTVLGTMFGSLFLVLLVTAMQAAGLPVGTQNIVKGILIILVLIVATVRSEEG